MNSELGGHVVPESVHISQFDSIMAPPKEAKKVDSKAEKANEDELLKLAAELGGSTAQTDKKKEPASEKVKQKDGGPEREKSKKHDKDRHDKEAGSKPPPSKKAKTATAPPPRDEDEDDEIELSYYSPLFEHDEERRAPPRRSYGPRMATYRPSWAEWEYPPPRRSCMDYDEDDYEWVDYDYEDLDFVPNTENEENGGRARQRQREHELSDDEERGATGPSALDDDLDIFGEFDVEYEDRVGPELPARLNQMAKNVWTLKKDAEGTREMMRSYPRPEKLVIKRVDINSELVQGVYPQAKKRDDKLRGVQESISRAAYPLLEACRVMWNKSPRDVSTIRMNLHALTFLSTANFKVNQTRRDLLKPGLLKKYHALCKIEKGEDCSEWLFGDSLTDKIKNNTQGSKAMKKPGFGANNYGFRGLMRGRSGYRGFRGASRFLGKVMPLNFHEKFVYCRSDSSGKKPEVEFQDGGAHEGQGRSIVHKVLDTKDKFVDCSDKIMRQNALKNVSIDCRPWSRQAGPLGEEKLRQTRQVDTSCANPQTPQTLVGEYDQQKMNEMATRKWGSSYKAGRVTQCVDFWSSITTDSVLCFKHIFYLPYSLIANHHDHKGHGYRLIGDIHKVI